MISSRNPIESAALPPGDAETGSPRDRDNGAPGRALFSIASAFARGFGKDWSREACMARCLREIAPGRQQSEEG